MPHRDDLKLFSKLCCEFSAVCVFSKKCPHIPMKNVIRPMITRLYKGLLGWYRVSIILVCKFKGFTEVYLDLQRVSIISKEIKGIQRSYKEYKGFWLILGRFKGLTDPLQNVSISSRDIQSVDKVRNGFSEGFRLFAEDFDQFQWLSKISFEKKRFFLISHCITKRGKGYYKTRQLYWMIILLQNEAKVLTKQVSLGITKRANGYYKTRQVLQNEAKVLTKRGRYYKTQQSLQNAAVHPALILV